MALGCISTSSPEFKEMAQRLNVSEGSLENIIHNYQESEGNASFPPDSYVLSKVEGIPNSNVVSKENLEKATQIWEAQFQPKVFPNLESAQAHIEYAKQFFKSEAIGLRERQDGSYEVTVQKPHTETINIYAGTGENVELSNFAERPFTINSSKFSSIAGIEVYGNDYKVQSVEQGFQLAKLSFGLDTGRKDSISAWSESIDNPDSWTYKIINAKSPAEARKIGRQIPLDSESIAQWDANSSAIMKELIKESLEQNPKALQKLLATGNATLTHIQDRGKWGTEFPRILMEVRDELRGTQSKPSTSIEEAAKELGNNSSYTEEEFPKILNVENSTESSNQQIRPENQEFLRKSSEFIRQVDNLLNSNEISATEVRHIAEQVVYRISDLLTDFQAHPEHIASNFPEVGEITAEEMQSMSRAQLVERIGVRNLIEGVKNLLFEDNPYFDDSTLLTTLDKASILSENFEALVRLASDTFALMEDFAIVPIDSVKDGFEIVENMNPNADNFNEQNDEASIVEKESLQEHWQVESRTLDVFNSASKLVKRALGQLLQRDENGNPIRSEFGINERVSPRDATESILHWTEGSLTLQDMIDKMKAKSSDHAWVNDLITRLEDKSGKETDFQSQFFSTFAKHRQTYSIVKKENGKWVSQPVNNAPAMRDALQQINATIKSGSSPLFTSEGVSVSKLASLRTFSDKLMQSRASNFEGANLDNIAKSFAMFSTMLGYAIDESVVRPILNTENLTKMTDALHYIVDTLEAERGNTEYDPFDFKSKTSIRGNIMAFLKPIVDQFEDTAISSFFDSGKMYQTYVTPSYLSKLFIKFHSEPAQFEEFIKNEYAPYGWFCSNPLDINNPESWRTPWLAAMASMPVETRKKMFAHKVELNFNSHNYMRNMSDSEYAISLIQEYWSEKSSDKGVKTAWYRLPMISNKPSSEFIRFVRYSDSFYKETITDGFLQIFNQELSRIQTVKERNKLIDKKNPAYIKNFDKNGTKFVLLDFLNDAVSLGEERAEFKSLIDRKTTETVNNRLTSDENKRLNDLAKKAIRNYMTERSSEIISKWREQGIVEAASKVSNITSDFNTVEEALENYIWNDTFAAMNILELTITDPAYYKNSEDLQKRLAQLHAPGIRANVAATDYNGNIVADNYSRSLVLKDFDNFKSNIIDNLNVVFDRKIAQASDAEKAGWKALKDSLTRPPVVDKDGNVVDAGGAYWQINVADAQAYCSPTAYRKKAFLFGRWSEHSEEIYTKLKKGEYKYNDLQAVFQPLKPFVYSQVNMKAGIPETSTKMNNIKVPVQFKNSEYLLIMAEAILKDADTGIPNLLRAIYQVMEESAEANPTRGIDTIQFESAVKSGLHGAIDIAKFSNVENGEALAKSTLEHAIYSNWSVESDAEGKLTEVHTGDYNPNYVTEVAWEDYCLQQEIPEHFKDHKQVWGSQIRYITISDLLTRDYLGNPVTFDFTDNGVEKHLDADSFKAEYEETAAENIREGIEAIAKELGIGGQYFLSKADRNVAISKILQREILSSPRYGVDLLQACSVDENGDFRIPLGDPIQSKRIEQLLNSIVKNRVNKQEIAGGPIVQVSNFGTSKQLNIRFKDKEGNLLKTRAEFEGTDAEFKKYIQDNQSGISYYECFVPIYMNSLFNEFKDSDGNINIEAIEKVNPDLLKLIGYRIPSEAKYSMAPLKIVGFMPREAGDGIMLPYDITLITGSDFDVDKFYIMRKDIKLNSKYRRGKERKEHKEDIVKYIIENNSDVASMQLSEDRLQAIQKAVDNKYNPIIDKLSKERDAEIETVTNEYKEKGKLEGDEFNKAIKKVEKKWERKIGEVEDRSISIRESLISKNLEDTKIKAVKRFLHNPNNVYTDNLNKSIQSTYLNYMYNTVAEPSGRVYRNNKIIDMTWAVLTHETTSAEILNPGGFEPQKRTGYMVEAYRSGRYSWEELNRMNTDQLKDASYISKNLAFPDVQIDFYRQNSAAGSILGMFAVQRVAHAALEGTGLVIDTAPFIGDSIHIGDFTIQGVMDIDPQTDSKGNVIGKTLGSLVASAADAVKDPVLNLMNINSTTANVLTSLIRLGMPFETAALFLSQKAIKESIDEFNKQNISGKYTTLTSVMNAKVEELEKSFGDTKVAVEGLSDDDLIKGINPPEDKVGTADILRYKALKSFIQISSLASALGGTTYITRFNSINSAAGPLIIDNIISRYKEENFDENIGLKRTTYFDTLTGDNVKVGDSIMVDGREVVLTENVIDDLLASGHLSSNTEVSYEAVKEKIYAEHPILDEFKNGKHLADQIFREIGMPAASRQFESVLASIPSKLTDVFYNDRKLMGQLSDFYQSYMLLASGAVKEVTKSGKNSLKFFIQDFPVNFMKKGYKQKYNNNPFIQAIKQDVTKAGRVILKIDTTGMDVQTKEKLISGWAEFHKAEPSASLQLFYYNFFRGGLGFSPETFMSLVPTYVKERIPNYKETFLATQDIVPELIIDQFIRNNVSNNKLVPENSFEISRRVSSNIMVLKENAEARSTPYIKIAIKDGGYALYRNTSTPNSELTFERVDILGNNGEYLEMSLNESPRAIENSVVKTTDVEKQTDVEPTTQDAPAINEPKRKSEREIEQAVMSLINTILPLNEQENLQKTPDVTKRNPVVKEMWINRITQRADSLGIKLSKKAIEDIYEMFC